MCKSCNIIKAIFENAHEDSHGNYYPVSKFMEALEKQKRIELYAGDCQLSEIMDLLEAEQHYTICHYLMCTQCRQVFFFGACIRGTPVYRMVDDICREKISDRIWGNAGTKYHSIGIGSIPPI